MLRSNMSITTSQQPADVVTYLMGPLVSLAGQMVTFTNVSAVSISGGVSLGTMGARGAETNNNNNNNNNNDTIQYTLEQTRIRACLIS